MEATTTANATTKYYSKTKLQNNNNNHQQNKTSTTTNKKTTYRETKESTTTTTTNDFSTQMVETTPATTQKKLTAKQTKAAAKLAAQQQQNAKSDTNNQQQHQQQQHNEASKKIVVQEKEANITTNTITNLPATTTNKSNTTAINANNNNNNANSMQQRNLATTANNNISFDKISNNNNRNTNNKNDNSSKNMNASDKSVNSSISDQQQQQLQNQQLENSNKSDSQQQHQQQPITDNNTSSSSMSWNNSKYLHKKFKRLASTTENDVLQETEKLRKTSLSSASSSVSSPPPPLPATIIHQQHQQLNQQQQQHQLHQQSLLSTTNEQHLTNGTIFNKHENNQHLLNNEHTINNSNNINSNKPNQGVQPLVQQQPSLHNEVILTNNINLISTPANVINSAAGVTTTLTASSSTAGGSGGRYKCPYCDLSCTKPSVLQKHIRAHTNERPYPCEICGIAFKTKSNLYKHCRSRSHAARQKGIEVSPDADDGLSDQDVDPELSNSSSEMFSRTGTPTEELSPATTNQQQQTLPLQHYALQTESQIVTAASINSSTVSPLTSTIQQAAGKPLNLQQLPQQQSHMLQLSSPAIGASSSTSSVANVASVVVANNMTTSSSQKQPSIDYKPYKPKFHNASLYNATKEAAAGATAVVSSQASLSSTIGSYEMQQLAPATTAVLQKDVSYIQKRSESPHTSINHNQHLIVASEQQKLPTSVHLPQPPQQSPNHLPHHPSLSPSTQIKLNNHINTHQLQQHQVPTPSTSHRLFGKPAPSKSLPLPMAAPVYYLGQPPGAPSAAMLHPPAHLPSQPFFNPLHMMTPQQQQQFLYQLHIQQQHLQQQQLSIQHSNRVAAAAAAAAAPVLPQSPSPTQSPHQQTSPAIIPSPDLTIKSSNQLPNTQHLVMTANNTRNMQHTKAVTSNANTTIVHPIPQNPVHYVSNATNAAQVALNPSNNIFRNTPEIVEQNSTINSQRTGSNMSNNSNPNTLMQPSVNSSLQEVTLNKEMLNEHINKLISQNEAIVENKELLLQKKYPKTLNRSRSFTTNINTASNSSTNSGGNTQVLQSTTGAPPSESPTNAKLAQAIVQKQQLQQQQQQQQLQQQQQMQQQYIYQQQQQQQQQHMSKQRYVDKLNVEEIPASLPLNGTSKHLVSKNIIPAQQHYINNVSAAISNPAQYQQYRTIVTITPTHPRQQPHSSPTLNTSNPTSITHAPPANLPLNLSAKSKLPEESFDLNKQPQGPLPQAPPPITPRKRHSIEQPQNIQQPQLLTPPTLTINEASNSSNSNSSTPQPSTSIGKYPTNNSIIKNLLLNARGLAVPTGTGDDAVYICPLCSLECRTAEELKLHNSTYCQGINSSANSPASSPSHKYFRSNSMSLNMPDFKILSKNPLSLAKLAWSQLKTKPSNLVLNRLSASVANTSKNSSTNTTTATTTQPTTQSTAATSVLNISTQQPKPLLTSNEMPIRFVDAPLPSPGPLLGKTPLVDYTPNESKSKSEEVIITKMHDDSLYTHGSITEHIHSNKRLKFESMPKRSPCSSSSVTSGGDMQLLSAQELSKKEERYKRFTSSGGCMIPLSECDDVDKSPKMIRTPLLSGGSFQEVSPKKDTKIPLPLMPGASQITPKLTLGLASSNGPQHFQFPPINQITAFNPLTLGLTEKVIPYVPGIPGPNSLQPQLPLAPPTAAQQHKQQLLSVAPAPISKQLSRTNSPNRNQTPSPMNMTSSTQQIVNTDMTGANKPTFGGVQNVPSEFNRAPPSTNMRNVRNWPPGTNSLPNAPSNNNNSNNSKTVNDSAKSLKTFNFMRMADNLSPRKNDNKPGISSSLTESETRHFNLDKMSREQLIITQPLNNSTSKSLSPTNLSLTPLHVDTNVSTNTNEIGEMSGMENKTKSKFLRPTSLPLRPGTFTPKRHHGITPTANTLPLISPETPRPSKECVQLYLNGNSYTYLGLKCSTKTFYCTLNCPQPSYVQDMHKLSMYSMWQQCAENNPHPLGLKPKEVMSLYDSRQKTLTFTMAKGKKIAYTLVAAQQTVMTPFISTRDKFYHHQLKPLAMKDVSVSKDHKTLGEIKPDNSKDSTAGLASGSSTANSQTLEGGYESHENYIYVRGRGRGKYVCSECGIRCKKPSMLKKHIRTHTDVRPYTCKHCNFSFKTKGNLTKHMQSKTHYKKCIELGLNPGPMPAEGDFLEPDVEFDQQSSTSAGGRTSSMGNGESDSDNDSSDNETESSNESDSNRSNVTHNLINTNAAAEDNKSHLEHEAARCLLTLSMTPPIHTQTLETSMANTQQIAVTAVSSSTPTPPIRRVISYTSPKPPFDYQKQEQYYSNPKEPKLKINNSNTTNFESAPIDLTKPRAMEVQPVQFVTHSSTSSFSSNPGPVQTQAQIRDVIFGVNKNESGFLKTMISVSSKVGRNFADNYEEHHHKLNEDMMLYDYRREQTLQYYKIKQTQLSRGMTVNPNVNMSNATPTTSTTVTTNVTLGSTTVTNSSSAVFVSSIQTTTTTINQKEHQPLPTLEKDIQLPKIEIIEPQESQKSELPVTAVVTNNATVVVTEPAKTDASKAFKSSDESEETDEEPPAKKVALQNDEKPAHNSNLPAAILQPGTTDFSGVLSGGGGSSNNNPPTRTVIVGEDGFTTNNNEILPVHPRVPQISNADGRPVCSICSKTFQKQSQLVLHMNIHYMERKYKCDPCSVSFRTQGHLQKHERSEAHKNKVIMTSTFGVPTTSNPRPFECTDCKIAFRIHGHLAKHLRSKTHVQKLECLQKLPFGTYAEIERAGISLTEIDTSDCENSLISLRVLAQKLIEKDPSSKLGSYTTPSGDNSNTGLVSQDSASEDGFTAAERAAATAIASLDNNSAANTPRRANSTSEDESIIVALNNNLKRRLPGTFSNGEESDKEFQEQEKRLRCDTQQINNNSQLNTASPTN